MADIENIIEKNYNVKLDEENILKLYKLDKITNIEELSDEAVEKAIESTRKRWIQGINGANEAVAKRDSQRLEKADNYESILRNKKFRKEIFKYYHNIEDELVGDIGFAKEYFKLISSTRKIDKEVIDFYFSYYSEEGKNRKVILEMLKNDYKLVINTSDEEKRQDEDKEKKKKKELLVANLFEKSTLIKIRKCEVFLEKARQNRQVCEMIPDVAKSLGEYLHIGKYDNINDFASFSKNNQEQIANIRYEKGIEYAPLVDIYNIIVELLGQKDVNCNFTEFKLLIQYTKLIPYMFGIEEIREKSLQQLYSIARQNYQFLDFNDFLMIYFIPIYDNFGIFDDHIKKILKNAGKESLVGKIKKLLKRKETRNEVQINRKLPLLFNIIYYIIFLPEYLVYGAFRLVKFLAWNIRWFSVFGVVPVIWIDKKLDFGILTNLSHNILEYGIINGILQSYSLVLDPVKNGGEIVNLLFALLITTGIVIIPIVFSIYFIWQSASMIRKEIDWIGVQRSLEMILFQTKESVTEFYNKCRIKKNNKKFVFSILKLLMIEAGMIAVVCGIGILLHMYGPTLSKNVNSYLDSKRQEVLSRLDESETDSSELEQTEKVIHSEILNSIESSVIAPESISATSELVSKKGNHYGAELMIDGDEATCWQEGKPDEGIGESISIVLNGEQLSSIVFKNGNSKSNDSYSKNNRLKKAKMIVNSKEEYILEFDDVNSYQSFQLNSDTGINSVLIQILEVYRGNTFNDTCISEVYLR